MHLCLAAAAAVMAVASCGQKKEAPKVLVLYYSQTQNTKAVAEEIATRLGADIEEILAVDSYGTDYHATIERCLKEREEGVTPEIQPVAADISAYDVIFLGYPVWFGTFAPPVSAFLDGADLSGKKIIPFCTFGSGGLDSSIRDIKARQPEAEVLPGYGVRAARIAAVPKEIDNFLKAAGLLEGEFFKPAEFPELHAVSEEEAAIFDAAVDGYPMLNAKAAEVASREIPGGVEYLFTAVPAPREDNPRMPPPGNVKVYVTVEEGLAPVFTQVVR